MSDSSNSKEKFSFCSHKFSTCKTIPNYLYIKNTLITNKHLKSHPLRVAKKGRGGIRTHGTLVTYDGFQDRSDKPLWHSSMNRYQIYLFYLFNMVCQELYFEKIPYSLFRLKYKFFLDKSIKIV